MVKKGKYGTNTLYLNGKMLSVETILGMGGMTGNGGGGEFKYDIFDIL
jgi:hypothetical protein